MELSDAMTKSNVSLRAIAFILASSYSSDRLLPDRRAHAALSGGFAGPDRVRLCGRRLARVEEGSGTAVRLSSPPGEESFPRFSPDGTKIAYSAAYDGNTDVYVVPAAGGEPVRLTHHPMGDRVIGWTPDGTRVLFASGRESGRQRFSQFFTVGVEGGLPEKLPVPVRRVWRRTPLTAGSSSTCRCHRTFETGSGTAAGGRQICGSST